MDNNEYIRKKIEAHKPKLYLHEEHSHLNKDGSRVFIISEDTDRAWSVALTTAGLNHPKVTPQEILDARFENALSALTNGNKQRKGMA